MLSSCAVYIAANIFQAAGGRYRTRDSQFGSAQPPLLGAIPGVHIIRAHESGTYSLQGDRSRGVSPDELRAHGGHTGSLDQSGLQGGCVAQFVGVNCAQWASLVGRTTIRGCVRSLKSPPPPPIPLPILFQGKIRAPRIPELVQAGDLHSTKCSRIPST